MAETKKVERKLNARVGFSRFVRDYGMLGVLILLCLLFSVLTLREQQPTGANAASAIEAAFTSLPLSQTNILIAIQPNSEDSLFSEHLKIALTERGFSGITVASGDPSTLRNQCETLAAGNRIDIIVTTRAYAPVMQSILSQIPALGSARLLTPPSYRWPTFLLADNIRNVANQIAVIAIIAIGMTMVIITAGIDLSVGSLIALSAVVAAWLIARFGGTGASTSVMLLSGAAGILLCGASGAFSGLVITRFRIPPFIATLAIMQVAAGVAYIISQGLPIYQIPDSFIILGRGVDPLLKIPYAVILMIALYIIAHILMTRTTVGRYIYAVGGNMEAARLAGIRVNGVLMFVYTLCGMLAGLGGVLMASQLKSGAPTYGITYELYVIAAVVVGGTSLSGGEGRIFGTLIGAFVIAVIQNGMNLTNVESYTQKVVLGLVILVAVLLDRLKQQGLSWRKKKAG
ncbi:sugar-transporting ATPase [candidate division GN15 bacterium]|uniref:Sugar-transporting ATPase n=1 Tax=candidate division GN15 bacterium TaxID=2072418 RepID=A0A855X8T6_9BACT|nr:MAG: sugar-transporting ATPase [candidate division GN15 bacterium]